MYSPQYINIRVYLAGEKNYRTITSRTSFVSFSEDMTLYFLNLKVYRNIDFSQCYCFLQIPARLFFFPVKICFRHSLKASESFTRGKGVSGQATCRK